MLELLLVPICFSIDQYYKKIAEEKLSTSENKRVLNDKINLRVVYNEGAFLGFLKKHPKLLMIINIFCITALLIYAITKFMSKGHYLIKIGIALMIGGGASNIYDRITKKKVIDYFSFSIKPNIYFNIADFFVFIGAAITMLGSLKLD